MTNRTSGISLSILVGLVTTLLGSGPARAATPVTSCPSTLDAPGGNYILTGNLTNCLGDFAVRISADNVKFNLNGFSISSGDGTGTGIFVGNEAGTTIVGVRVRGGTVSDFNVGVGLHVADSARVGSMTLTGNKTGVELVDSHNNRINDNNVIGNVIGVFVANSNNNSFSTNLVTNNVSSSEVSAGYFLSDANGNTIDSNDISFNGGAGVHLQDFSDGNIIQNNTVNGTANVGSRGIAVQSGTNNTIRGNEVSNGQSVGIVLFENATGNVVTSNTALGNTDLDLGDANANVNCDGNLWTNNTFVTDNEAGAAFGPGAGCIQ